MSAPTNDDSHLWVTWDDYNRLIERLALQVHQSGWQFDKILCLARGGVRVGDVMSRIFDVPLGILATSSYREAAGTKQGDMDIAQFITITRGTLSGRVLLVDDMVDTGMTFNKVFDHLKNQFAEITELRSAVLWWKGHSGHAGLLRRQAAHQSLDSPAVRGLRQPAAAPTRSLDPQGLQELSRRIARRQGGAGRRLCPVYGQNPAARARIAGYR